MPLNKETKPYHYTTKIVIEWESLNFLTRDKKK